MLDAHQTYYGRSNFAKLEIEVNDSDPLDRQRECLLHELVHISSDLFMSGGDCLEERQVKIVAGSLLQILRDNPGVAAFLLTGG